MSEILDLRHMLVPSSLTHYVPNDVIQGHDPDDGIQMAAHIMVSERHSKFALVDMTACLLSQKAALTARVAELEAALKPFAHLLPLTGCGCQTCRPITMTDMRMVLCETCGNKRCPHATNHRNACTGSNEPGQPGSVYR